MSSGRREIIENDPIARQYERWVYPAPAASVAELLADPVNSRYRELHAVSQAYWPDRPIREELDLLVAGCGTMAAPLLAALYPQSRVVGIDVSAASLSHAERLARTAGLTNVALRQLRVEDVAELGVEFDLVITHGVLHHLVDPAAGLHALGRVLRTDGVIDVMIYAPYGRAGVYMLQDLFRLMGLGTEPSDVEIVKQTLGALSPKHPVQRYLAMATDLDSDHGVVDTFLNPRERAFTVADCLDLVRQAGLVFQGWDDNGLYYPDAYLNPGHPLCEHLRRLDEPRQWQAVELLSAAIPTHWFYCCRPDRDPRSYRVRFDSDAFLRYVPQRRISEETPADPARQTSATIARPPFPRIVLGPWQEIVFRAMDGRRTVSDCLATACLPAGWEATVESGRAFFSGLWRLGYALFRIA
jgi:SAM-dependent methyltransferase